MSKISINTLVATSLLGLLLTSEIQAKQITAKEAQFKAALIYKMGSYVSWVPPKEIINYCFVGEETLDLSNILQQKQQLGELANPITVSNHTKLEAEKLTNCDIVYARNSQEVNIELLTGLPSWIFTISDSSQALDKGFIASIELYNKKPLLTISKSNLKKAEVSVNSRLLSYVQFK